MQEDENIKRAEALIAEIDGLKAMLRKLEVIGPDRDDHGRVIGGPGLAPGLDDFVPISPDDPDANSYNVVFWSFDRRLHGQHVYAPDEETAKRWASAMFKEAIIPEFREQVFNSVEDIRVTKV